MFKNDSYKIVYGGKKYYFALIIVKVKIQPYE